MGAWVCMRLVFRLELRALDGLDSCSARAVPSVHRVVVLRRSRGRIRPLRGRHADACSPSPDLAPANRSLAPTGNRIMIHLPELPRILPRQITRLFRRIVATMRAPHHWGCSRLGLIMAAAFTVGCTEASSPRADDPIVVDVVWGDGRKTRMELSSQEAPAEQQGRPVAFLLVEDGEIVQEFVKARFARSRPEAGPVSLQDIDESPVLQLVNEMMSAVPSLLRA